jgi:histidinol phosphatase-like PHP family hydrolase
MIDLHTHTLFSDGELLPSEIVYRAKVKGYRAIALTDHGDASTFDFVIPRLRRVAAELERHYGLIVVPGVEITYVPPALIGRAVRKCRALGARLVVVHGETPAETVPPGTNNAAIRARADILAHPGPISEDDVRLAVRNNVCLEITTRAGHNRTNRHVARLALRHGASLIMNTDSHAPENLLDAAKIRATLAMSGLPRTYYDAMLDNSTRVLTKIGIPRARIANKKR